MSAHVCHFLGPLHRLRNRVDARPHTGSSMHPSATPFQTVASRVGECSLSCGAILDHSGRMQSLRIIDACMPCVVHTLRGAPIPTFFHLPHRSPPSSSFVALISVSGSLRRQQGGRQTQCQRERESGMAQAPVHSVGSDAWDAGAHAQCGHAPVMVEARGWHVVMVVVVDGAS